MKITEDIISRLEKALDMRKKNGEPIWEDGTEIEFGPSQIVAIDGMSPQRLCQAFKIK